ncbi:S41 family peptidase [uncultured Intestinimonas sp.]|uniref:S41 family peptidase n=1 Tax=uncultured Intestinimonas sp. TaxID=1689265 RepID=UPI0025DD02BF|nr:S41 family peptidase [uncultured Intestinimonas sp.]
MKGKKAVHILSTALALALALPQAAGAIGLEEARTLLRENYIDEIPEEILALPTIDEITDAIGDPYTYYMTAEEYEQFQTDLNGAEVVGIGVMVEKKVDGLEVIGIAPDAPAHGVLETGDLIVAADGVTLEEAGTPDALAALIAGEEGTSVTLTVLRDGESHRFTFVREQVVYPTVTGEVVDGHIGWLDCNSFGEDTGDYFETYITEEDPEADRWVVDLRGNPGGSATAVVEAVGHVLGNYDVAYLVDRQGSVGVWRPVPLPVEIPGLIQEPLVVLVDASSASAAELFAAAIRDYHYGLIIGTRTFGKGIAQNVFEQEDGSAFKITTFRYYSADYVTPDRSGVLPHLVVDADLADEVAVLLSGEVEEQPAEDVLVIRLAGQDWYVHRDQAADEDLAPAFSELLSALAPGTPMTLDGQAVTPAEAAEAWGVDYVSRWFGDVESSPYADQLNALAVLGVLLGDENGSFAPESQLTRAELAALITQGMGYWCWESQGDAPYTDVGEDDWFRTVANITYHLDLIQGNEQGEFDPDAPIDYQQFLTILLRMGQRADLTIDQCLDRLTEEELGRPEVAKFAPWAQPAAAAAEQLGLLLTDLEDIDPEAPVTREEAGAMLYAFLDYTGILTPAAEE